MLPTTPDRRKMRYALLLISALLGAMVGYAAFGALPAAMLALLFPGLILAVARLREHLYRQAVLEEQQRQKEARLALLDEVCRNEARVAIRDRYSVASRYTAQYDPDSAQRKLMERVTQLYRLKRNDGAEEMLQQAHRMFPGSPYVAARHARMLLQDLRIEEAREVIEPALATHPDEISLLILRAGLTRADDADHTEEVTAEIQDALAEMVEWAGMQLELIIGRTGVQLRDELDVVIH